MTGIVFSLIAFIGVSELPGQVPDSEKIYIFPDEYSELEDYPVITESLDQDVQRALENSRQKYLSALIYINKKDTTTAAKYFEEALNELNILSSYPGIEDNENFMELSNAIIDDYEYYITE